MAYIMPSGVNKKKYREAERPALYRLCGMRRPAKVGME
jgi:hypothetical protein